MIAQYVVRNHRSWDERIPELQFAYNFVRYEATGYLPVFKSRPQIRRVRKKTAAKHVTSPPDTTRRHLEKAFKLVQIYMGRAFQHQRRYDFRRRLRKLKIREVDMEA